MTNPVLILSYNALPLLQKCVESVRAQDIPTTTLIYDNGSTDGTTAWLPTNMEDDRSVQAFRCLNNTGVSAGWNWGLRYFFGGGAKHVLVLNQDLRLPCFAYRELLNCNVPLVTGFPVESEDQMKTFSLEMEPHPCFSAFLIRRSCWETVGEFDERMFGWSSDCDYHVRGHLLGVPMMKSRIPFLHHAGTTLRSGNHDQRAWFARRADADRAVFKKIYGVEPGQDGYADLFAPELYGIKERA